MKSARTLAVAVLLCMVAGCKHKSPAPPQAAQAPILPPGDMVKYLPPPVLPPPTSPNVVMGEDDSAKQQPARPKHPSRHRSKPAEAAQPPLQIPKEGAPSTPAANDASSPIGELSTAGDVANLPDRGAILEQIHSTENGLNNIGHSLNSEQKKTAAQLRTFLAKATQLLDQNDLDGAQTLVTKARVLLDELKKP